MKKDHQINVVGPWAEKKLKALEDYIRFYSTALKRQSFTRVYIDAFAGSCLSKVRSLPKDDLAVSFFDDEESAVAQDVFIKGSPIRALSVADGFHRHYFFDLDEERAGALKQLQLAYPHKNISVSVGDSNPSIQALARTLHNSNIRGVAFLDPYGPHLQWKTIEALAATKNFEVIINFPADMAINRLIKISGNNPEKWEKLLDGCFGTEEWRTIAYSVHHDLFGHQVTQKNVSVPERLLGLYMSRLKSLFSEVATPRLIRNTKKAPLYYLIWAGQHPLGRKGADYILSQGERVKLTTGRLQKF